MAFTLSELRRRRGVTQRQLARALGLSHGAIGNYEAGIATPSFRTARRIARFFGVHVDDIIFPGEIRDTQAVAGDGESQEKVAA